MRIENPIRQQHRWAIREPYSSISPLQQWLASTNNQLVTKISSDSNASLVVCEWVTECSSRLMLLTTQTHSLTHSLLLIFSHSIICEGSSNFSTFIIPHYIMCILRSSSLSHTALSLFCVVYVCVHPFSLSSSLRPLVPQPPPHRSEELKWMRRRGRKQNSSSERGGWMHLSKLSLSSCNLCWLRVICHFKSSIDNNNDNEYI